MTNLRNNIANLLLNPQTNYLLALFLVINALTLGLEYTALETTQFEDQINTVNYFFQCFFTMEFLLHATVFGKRWFSKDYGFLFHYYELAAILIAWAVTGTTFEPLRCVRLIRFMTLLSSLKRIIDVMSKAWNSIMQTFGLMLLIFYIYSILTTHFWAKGLPHLFGHLTRSMHTLFGLALYDNWGNITDQITAVYPNSYVITVSFTIIISVIVLNLFIAFLTNALGNNDSIMEESDLQGQIDILKGKIDKIDSKIDQLIKGG